MPDYRTPEQQERWEKRKRATAECQEKLVALAAELLRQPRREPQPSDIMIPLRTSRPKTDDEVQDDEQPQDNDP